MPGPSPAPSGAAGGKKPTSPYLVPLVGVGLVVAFSGALGAGRLVGPSEEPPPAAHAEAGGHADTWMSK